jgi:hypothetical protein
MKLYNADNPDDANKAVDSKLCPHKGLIPAAKLVAKSEFVVPIFFEPWVWPDLFTGVDKRDIAVIYFMSIAHVIVQDFKNISSGKAG